MQSRFPGSPHTGGLPGLLANHVHNFVSAVAIADDEFAYDLPPLTAKPYEIYTQHDYNAPPNRPCTASL